LDAIFFSDLLVFFSNLSETSSSLAKQPQGWRGMEDGLGCFFIK
jgi:hypothetical protein